MTGQRSLRSAFQAFPGDSNSLFKFHDEVFDALDQLAEELISPRFRPRLKEIYQTNSKFPPIEILEQKNNLIIKLYIAGYDKEDIQVEYDKNIESFVVIGKSYIKFNNPENFELKVTYSEIKKSSFQRNIPVPLDKIEDLEKVVSKVKDGILEITIPCKHLKQIKEEQKKKFLIE